MDELVLALFQGPGFAIEGPLFLLFALIMGWCLAHALWTGRIGSGEQRIDRAEEPRRFGRAILVLAAFTLFLLALTALAFFRLEEFKANMPLALPFIFIAMILSALRRGVAFDWSRAEQPRLYWGGVAFMTFGLVMVLGPALDALARLR